MGQTNHTPGPWHVFEPLSKFGTAASVGAWLPDGKSRNLICEAIDQTDDPYDHETGLANARLIASAPSLLAACEAALDFLNRMQDELKHRGEALAQRDNLRAAIAKARGN